MVNGRTGNACPSKHCGPWLRLIARRCFMEQDPHGFSRMSLAQESDLAEALNAQPSTLQEEKK